MGWYLIDGRSQGDGGEVMQGGGMGGGVLSGLWRGGVGGSLCGDIIQVIMETKPTFVRMCSRSSCLHGGR